MADEELAQKYQQDPALVDYLRGLRQQQEGMQKVLEKKAGMIHGLKQQLKAAEEERDEWRELAKQHVSVTWSIKQAMKELVKE